MSDTPVASATRSIHSETWSAKGSSKAQRTLVAETPIALVFNGTTVAVMMATPAHIKSFALGFALTEGYIAQISDIESFEEVPHADGIEARMWVSDPIAARITERQRKSFGPMGCGLCGIDSLSQALRSVPQVGAGVTFEAQDICDASASLKAFQPLHDKTHAAHAAGFLTPEQGIVCVMEDVGRHNALDKLCGALAERSLNPQTGAMIVTSRMSVDLVQKAATQNCPILIGVSAPSSRAVKVAEDVGLTLIAFCRPDRFEVFTHSNRVIIGS